MVSTDYLMKKIYLFFIIVVLVSISSGSYSYGNDRFIDVPDNHWAVEHVYRLNDLGIVQGTINEKNELVFGLENDVTRAEFVTMLVKLINNTNINESEMKFTDINEEEWYYKNIKLAVEQEMIIQSLEEYEGMRFNPNQAISRMEMAKMIVRAMGYDYLAKELYDTSIEFDDVNSDKGYVKIAKDFGIINGKYDDSGQIKLFSPNDAAKRSEAVTMISILHNTLNNNLNSLHGFYAINSYSQIDKILGFNSIGFGWNGLIYNTENKVVLSSTKSLGNDYYLPEGYIEPFLTAIKNDSKTYLMVYSSNHKINIENGDQADQTGILEHLLNNDDNQREIIDSIIKNVSSMGNKDNISFESLIWYLEGLKDRNGVRKKYVDFLQSLKEKLQKENKELIVCLHPIREGRSYFDGYDYEKIGEVAHKVIIMAHDYSPRNISDLDVNLYKGKFPLAPIEDVYEGIAKTLEAGIPKEKVILQVSLNKEEWTAISKGNTREWNNSYISSGKIYDLIKGNDLAIVGYDTASQAPYIFIKDNNDKLEKIIWYEDSRSVNTKLKLAKDFGLDGISIWRLGLIGDSSHDENNEYHLDTWSQFNKINQN